MTLVAACMFGLLLGMRHAIEPDHLAAVATLMAESRSAGRGLLLGILWGLGHALSLFVVGALLAALHTHMPPTLADLFELAVAVMLLALGVRSLRRGLRLDSGAAAVCHPDALLRPGLGSWLGLRSLGVGAVHGLAGSGALTALVLAELPTTAARLGYTLLFGLGSTLGMAGLSTLLGWPLARFAGGGSALRAVTLTTGLFATGLGLVWGWPLVVRLFA